VVELTRKLTMGESGNDKDLVTDLDDLTYGNAGNDKLSGCMTNDMLDGGGVDDILYGGKGNDHLLGGLGVNHFHVRRGDGYDLIVADAVFAAPYSSGMLLFDAPIRPDEASYRRSADDLIISFAASADSVTIQDFFWQNTPANVRNPVSAFYFMGSESYLSADQMLARVSNLIQGSSAANTLIGGLGDDLLQGGAGSETASYSTTSGGVRVDLSLETAQDTDLIGSPGADQLRGNAAANTIEAGVGHNQVTGGAGTDTIVGFDNLTGYRFADTLTGSA
jgi:Ca2+-binding RTX toxin-like protein